MQFSVRSMMALTALVGLLLMLTAAGGWQSQLLTVLSCGVLVIGGGLLGASFPKESAKQNSVSAGRIWWALLALLIVCAGLLMATKGLGDSLRAAFVAPGEF